MAEIQIWRCAETPRATALLYPMKAASHDPSALLATESVAFLSTNLSPGRRCYARLDVKYFKIRSTCLEKHLPFDGACNGIKKQDFFATKIEPMT